MSKKIDYSKEYDNEFEQFKGAIADCKNWLSDDDWTLLQSAIDSGVNRQTFLFGCMMQGVHGYPARCLYKHMKGLQK